MSETLNATLIINKELVGSIADSAFTRNIFVADDAYQVVAVTERHSVLGSTTIQLVKAVGSTPIGSATNLLASTIDLTAAVDVFRSGVLIASTALQQLAAGDGLGVRWTNANNLPAIGILSVKLVRI